jgi:bacteriocin biosynthesis cyclodehydratase domain-containing protein
MTTRPSTARRPVRRPVLAPGLRVVSRGAGDLQVGLTDQHRLRLVDTPAVRRVLDALDRGEPVRDTSAHRRALAALSPVVRDRDALLQPGVPPDAAAAAILQHPDDGAARLARRSRHRVAVAGDPALAGTLRISDLLRRTGLGTAATKDDAPSVVLVVTHGEPPRRDLDGLVRRATPHLLLRAVESDLVLGPFVVPGRTACLRCLDAHDAAADPTRPRVLEEQQRSVRHDGVVEPLDLAAATVAIGWAVSDLLRFAEGDRPTTWSATTTFTSGLASVRSEPRLRHPGCGCAWSSGDAVPGRSRPSVTMEG